MNDSEITKILIVEDNLITAKGIEKSLKDMGYTVVGIASNEAKTLELVSSESPALVLMDIKLKGGEDGVEIAQKVQSQFDVPVIFLTAYTDDDTVLRVYHSGTYGYLIKPFRDELLQEAIEAALERHRFNKEAREE